MRSALLFYALSCALGYHATVKRLNNNEPIVTSQNGGSSFTYNYNPSYCPLFDQNGNLVNDALLVRSQPQIGSDVYTVGPSVITITRSPKVLTKEYLKLGAISESSIIIEPHNESDSFGTEDPRLVYDPNSGLYFLLYSAVQNDSSVPISRLALATTETPLDASSWVRHGPLFPDIAWSKSGALLINNKPSSNGPAAYLIWGDSTLIPGLTMAISFNLFDYTNLPGLFMSVRNNSFDSVLIEAGPMPLPLSDGNYLFLYNSARSGYPSAKPNWDLQYNPGWVVLNGTNPLEIIARSDEPFMSPTLDWEIGLPPYLGLTPNVIFVEGWKSIGKDKFLIFYGGADSVVGAAELHFHLD